MINPLPESALKMINDLSKRGYAVYAVKECVRDMYIEKNGVYDLTVCEIVTNAPPFEIAKKHKNCKASSDGTNVVTVCADGAEIKVRSFASASAGDLIEIIRKESENAAFTCDTLMFDGRDTIDLFGGISDIESKKLKIAGDKEKCISEHPEMILKALSYVSLYSFDAFGPEKELLYKYKSLIHSIKPETVLHYFTLILTGRTPSKAIEEYLDIIAEIVPQIKMTVGFEQHSKYHCFDVFEHTMRSIDASERDAIIRICLFFHDLGKPETYTFDGQSGHFRGHNKKSAEIAVSVLKRLGADRATLNTVSALVFAHDMKSNATMQNAEKLIARYGIINARRLLQIQRADILAHHPDYTDTSSTDKLLSYVDEAIKTNKCVTVKQLSVSTRELCQELNLDPFDANALLMKLLFAVIEEKVPNDKKSLISYAINIKNKKKE